MTSFDGLNAREKWWLDRRNGRDRRPQIELHPGSANRARRGVNLRLILKGKAVICKHPCNLFPRKGKRLYRWGR